ITKDNFVFQYWYLDDINVPYDFSTPVTTNLMINAYWLESFQVTFNPNNDDESIIIDVIEGSQVTRITDVTKEGYTFAYWFSTDDSTPYDFSTPVTDDLALNAKWELTEAGITALINEDIAYVESHLYLSDNQLNFARNGQVNNSFIVWMINSKHIMSNGVLVRISDELEDSTTNITARFLLNNVTIEKVFQIDLALKEVVISDKRSVSFENLTTEYDVIDGSMDLYFEEDGSIPYVKLDDFFGLIEGFIDPEVDFTKTLTSNEYMMEYQYYSVEEDHTYDLILTINTDENTISVNDPGFYWAYVYSTETNYGRHINYLSDYLDESNEEGGDLVFDLDDYGMDALFYEESLVLPFYLTNQLFAGSSYYNVCYNYDSLYGIYSLPKQGSDEYELINTSSMNGEQLPIDLVIHNFNMLAFNLDNFYGLRDILDIETYYDLLYANKTKLLSTSAKTFDNALFDLLYKTFDDPHTSYGSKSYFNSISWEGPSLTSLDQLGPRYRSLYVDGFWAVDDEIMAKWDFYSGSGAAYSENRPLYWFVDDEMTTVVLQLNDFSTSDIDEDNGFNSEMIANSFEGITQSLIPTINFGDKFFYYNSSTQTYDFSEIIIKHADMADYTDYQNALTNFGYVYNAENDFYTHTIDGHPYTLSIVYDAVYQVIYIGLIQAELPSEDIGDVFVTDIEDIIYADSAVYMEFIIEEILEENPLVENIVLDVTANGGGNVGALYRVVGFITDEPFKVTSMNVGTQSKSTSYIQIDGIQSYGNLNWALLTSHATYSAASELATIFMENDFGPILGVQSGGGSASITPVLLPNGTSFTMSSNNLNGYRTGSGTEEDPYVYSPNEFGITVDYEIPIGVNPETDRLYRLIYDNDTLMGYINQYYAD
ncbi:MAG: InlB B-repeat-containing protein, partial [Acholeplasmataceae bacterium]|nr:InlB B-repeat-containing protein [Acholeplasmataceae bacterium]